MVILQKKDIKLVIDQVDRQVYAPVPKQMGYRVDRQVWNYVISNIWRQLFDRVNNQVREPIVRQIYANNN